MYGRTLNARMPLLSWYDPSPFITTSDDFGRIDEKGLSLVQEAYICCSGQFPKHPASGSLWVCNICERVWGVPEDGSSSWTLTRFKVVEPERKAYLAYHSYRWWLASIALGVITMLATFLVFLVMLWSDTTRAVYASMAVYLLGIVITALFVTRWRKLLNQYNLSLYDN